MNLKAYISRWLGLDIMENRLEYETDQKIACVVNAYEIRLEAQRVEYERLVAKLKEGFQLTLDASLQASFKISKVVSERGDAELKAYVDACIESVREVLQ